MSYSQIGQDKWVLEKLGNKRNGFYVDVGASDGITINNTYLLFAQYGWSGILAEPCRSVLPKLKEFRSTDKDVVYPGAIAWYNGSVQFKEFGLQELSTINGYQDKDKLAGARSGGIEYSVPCITLEKLLTVYSAPRCIDYLSIDTEGSEFDILKIFPFRDWDIKVITVEHNNTSNQGKINKLLVQNGYILDKSVQWEDWYIKETIWGG